MGKSVTELTADYLVVGSGATGMAFTDALVTETAATVVMVDRHHRPGGHWNDAYPYVRLHQPSSFYGVNSRPLGGEVKDQTGWNAGLYELASGAEVCAYFDHVMRRQFLPSGRVRYFPRCAYEGDGRFTSIPSGREFQVHVGNKTVDTTYMDVRVPSVCPPPYPVAPGVRCVPLNDLPRVERPESGYVIVGAGKTGMDACLWLLENGVDPADITWIMPRDAWFLDRANLQRGELLSRTALAFAGQLEAIAGAGSVPALFDALEACGWLLRLDPSVRPTMYRCATVTRAELEQLRRIRNVVRQGRVKRLEPDRMVLEQGTLPADPGRLYVDCSAAGLPLRPITPVFDGARITLQPIRGCQPAFSAAFVGHVEAAYRDEAEKNELCGVVQYPDTDVDFLRMALADGLNQVRWARDAELVAWMDGARLNLFSIVPDASGAADPALSEGRRRFIDSQRPAIDNLKRLLAEAEPDG